VSDSDSHDQDWISSAYVSVADGTGVVSQMRTFRLQVATEAVVEDSWLPSAVQRQH